MSANETPPEDWTTEEGVAHHEAGHHIAFRYLRAGDDEGDYATLSIVPIESEGSLGHHAPLDGAPQSRLRPLTREEKAEYELRGWPTDRGVEDFQPEQVENYIIELYAGGTAELRHNPGCESARWHLAGPEPGEEEAAEARGPFGGNDDDRETAEAWLAWIAPDRQARAVLRDHLRARAVTFVDEKWDEIVVVAKELVVWKTIDGYEAGLAIKVAKGDEEAAAVLEEYRALQRD